VGVSLALGAIAAMGFNDMLGGAVFLFLYQISLLESFDE
jgi:hypothetical protein